MLRYYYYYYYYKKYVYKIKGYICSIELWLKFSVGRNADTVTGCFLSVMPGV